MKRAIITKTFYTVVSLSIAFAVYSCAAIAPPSGGPDDKTPPIFIGSMPESGTTQFGGGKVVLKFSEYIDKKTVKLEHHAFPLDLAALNAEKIVRCAPSPDAKFELLTKIYDKQKEWAVGSDIKKINQSLIKIGTDSKINDIDLRACLDNDKTQEIILNENEIFGVIES